jgi:hypothetical protein
MRPVEKLTRYPMGIGTISTEGSSKYFMTISCIPANTHRTHILFQLIVLYGCTFANVYINTLLMSSLYIVFYGQKKNVLRVRACSMSTTVTSGKGLILMLPANVGISPFQCQRLGWNRRAHCHGSLSTTWQADCSTISWFSGSCSTGAAWRYASVRQRLRFHHDGAPLRYSKMPNSGWTQHIQKGGLDI